jgi:hypothetical protein
MARLLTTHWPSMCKQTRASSSLRSGTGLASYNTCVPSFYYCGTKAQTLSQIASQPAAYDIGFIPSKRASTVKPKFIYLLAADELSPTSIPPDAFIVYQGHHWDLGASLADVCCQARRTRKSRRRGSTPRDGRSWDGPRSLLLGLPGRIGRLFGGSPLCARSKGVTLDRWNQLTGRSRKSSAFRYHMMMCLRSAIGCGRFHLQWMSRWQVYKHLWRRLLQRGCLEPPLRIYQYYPADCRSARQLNHLGASRSLGSFQNV